MRDVCIGIAAFVFRIMGDYAVLEACFVTFIIGFAVYAYWAWFSMDQ